MEGLCERYWIDPSHPHQVLLILFDPPPTGGFKISVLRYWHTFGSSVLRAQDLRKGKDLF
jgi:hypothetical protein